MCCFVSAFLQVLRHAFTYHWKLWTIPEVLELLHEAGFPEVHVWIRCMIVSLWAVFGSSCLARPAVVVNVHGVVTHAIFEASV